MNRFVKLFFLGVMIFVASPRAMAQTIGEAGSLQIVPADADFYFASLNHDDMLSAFVESRAYTELSQSPLVISMGQLFVDSFEEGAEMSLEEMRAQAADVLGEQQLDDLFRLLIDIGSHEMFVYGSSGYSDFMESGRAVSQRFYDRYEQSPKNSETAEELTMQAYREFADEYLEQVKLPDLVLGFRVEDVELADRHLELLHGLITLAMFGGEVPLSVRRGYLKQQIGEGDYLTLKLNGELLPLDVVVSELSDIEEELVERYVDHIREMEVVMAVGTFRDYVILSVSDSTEHLEELGNVKPIAELEEWAPLEQHKDEKFAWLSYVSESMRSAAESRNIGQQIAFLLNALSMGASSVATTADQAETFRQLVTEDGRKLDEQLAQYSREQGARIEFGYFVPDGFEVWFYDYREVLRPDSESPLRVLSHLDSYPCLFYAKRCACGIVEYRLVRDWLLRADWYMQNHLADYLDPEFMEGYAAIREVVAPFASRFDSTTQEKFLPATDGEEFGLIFDLRNGKRQWDPTIPPTREPLPLPEFALVISLADQSLFLEAMDEYDLLVRDVFAEINSLTGGAIPPELRLDEPVSKLLSDGTAYYYPFDSLEAIGLADAFRPNLAVGDELAVFAISTRHSERLLTPKPLEGRGPFELQDQPLNSAAGFNFPVVANWLEAWFFFSDQLGAFDDLETDDAFPVTKDELLESIETGLTVAKCFLGLHAVTWVEDGVTITRNRTMFEDIQW